MDKIEDAGGELQGHARGRARAQGRDQEGTAAQAGEAPVHKSAEGFDWSHVRFSEGWGRDDMLSLGFVGPREDLVFFGKTGRGKTHMAVTLAMRTAAAIWSSPNTAPHRLNSRFVVMTTDCRS